MARKAIYDTEPTVLVSCRMPQSLKEQLDRYASMHRLTLSELLLDGARMRLELDDPRALLPVGHEPARQTDMTRMTEQVAELAQRLARLEARAAQASAEVLTGQQSPPLADEPDFDTTRFMLGPLCHQRHDWRGTGQSVRQKGGKHECRECKRARKARYKQRQKSSDVLHV